MLENQIHAFISSQIDDTTVPLTGLLEEKEKALSDTSAINQNQEEKAH